MQTDEQVIQNKRGQKPSINSSAEISEGQLNASQNQEPSQKSNHGKVDLDLEETEEHHYRINIGQGIEHFYPDTMNDEEQYLMQGSPRRNQQNLCNDTPIMAQSKLQKSSRYQYQQLQQQTPAQNQASHRTIQTDGNKAKKFNNGESAQKVEGPLELLPNDRMTLFQVGFITAAFTEADILWAYIQQILQRRALSGISSCLRDEKFYSGDHLRQCKAASFLTKWMGLAVPQMIKKFKAEHLVSGDAPLEDAPSNISDENFRKNLGAFFIILDESQPVYNQRLGNNSFELYQQLKLQNLEIFKNKQEENKQSRRFVKDYFEIQTASSIFFVNSLEVFCQAGGFELLKLTLTQNPKRGSRNTSYEPKDPSPSFGHFMKVLNLVNNLKEYLRFDFFKELAIYLRDACLQYAKNQSDEEFLRNVDKKEPANFVYLLESILSSLVLQGSKNGEQINFEFNLYQYTEQIELFFALRCLQMPILEKKFIGHAILLQKINQVKMRQAVIEKEKLQNKTQHPGQGTHVSTIFQLRQKWLTQEILLQWMQSNKIFYIMFGESFHPEVIKKSYSLLEFMCHNAILGAQEIDMMWDSAFQKHEAYKLAILRALMFLASKFKCQELSIIFLKIKQIPLNQTDKFIMNLLKIIAKNISLALEQPSQKNQENLSK